MPKSQKTDITIVGGGIVGLALAKAISLLGYNLILIEAREIDSPTLTDLDNRSIAVSYPTVSFLDSLGIWENLQDKSQLINKIHVSDKGKYGQTTINGLKDNLPFLGAVIEMPYLHSELIKSIVSSKVKVISPANVLGMEKFEEGYFLKVESDEGIIKIESKLIIACDGANSKIREGLDLPVIKKKYDQTALVFNVQLKRQHEGIAYERFYNDGVLAMLPLTNNRCGCIWTMKPEDAEEFKSLESKQILQRVQKHFGYRLGKMTNIGKVGMFPLSLIRAEELYSDNVLLFGNAAHFLHPVSAQGFNLSVRDIGTLYDLIVKLGLADCNNQLLQEYEKFRLHDQKRTASITNGVVDIFGNQSMQYILGRNIGLHLLERSNSSKKLMNKIMMGRDGKLSSLHLNKVES